jgi:hypothetical protein
MNLREMNTCKLEHILKRKEISGAKEIIMKDLLVEIAESKDSKKRICVC